MSAPAMRFHNGSGPLWAGEGDGTKASWSEPPSPVPLMPAGVGWWVLQVILRVAVINRAYYEFYQHYPVCLQVGCRPPPHRMAAACLDYITIRAYVAVSGDTGR
jgi:hypothetical protein